MPFQVRFDSRCNLSNWAIIPHNEKRIKVSAIQFAESDSFTDHSLSPLSINPSSVLPTKVIFKSNQDSPESERWDLSVRQNVHLTFIDQSEIWATRLEGQRAKSEDTHTHNTGHDQKCKPSQANLIRAEILNAAPFYLEVNPTWLNGAYFWVDLGRLVLEVTAN